MTTAASVSPPATTTSDTVASTKTHGTPNQPSVKSSPLSTWFSPSQSTDRSKQPTNASGDKSTPEAEKSSSSVFGSTWGGGDSFWRSYLGTPSTSDQGGRGGGGGEKKTDADSVKDPPKPTSMHRGVGSRKMKSSASSAVKSESGDKRKTATSPSINSPPKSSSTPLPQARAKSSTTTDKSFTPASSKPAIKPPEHSTTPKTSLKSQQSKKALLKANIDSTEASTSESSTTKVRPEKVSNRGSRASPMPTALIKDTGVETTDDGSTGTGTVDVAVPKVEQKALTQRELAESSRKTDADLRSPETREHLKTDCDNGELTNKELHDFQSLSTPQCTAMDSASQTQTITSSKSETTGQAHSHPPPPTHHSTQSDSTETKTEQVTPQQDEVNTEDHKQTISVAEQNALSNVDLESISMHTSSISEAKSNKREKQVTRTRTSKSPELRHGESKEEEGDQSAKVTDEKGASLQQMQVPMTSTEQQTFTAGTPASVIAEAAEKEGHTSVKMAELEEGRRQPAESERKVGAGSSKEERSEEGHSNPDVDKLKKVGRGIQ